MARPSEANKAKYEALVIAVAGGQTITEFCRRTRVPRPTVNQWTTTPEFREDVEALRREARDQGIGILTAAHKEAAEGMVQLARKSGSDAVRLQAQVKILEIASLETLQREVRELKAEFKRRGKLQ